MVAAPETPLAIAYGPIGDLIPDAKNAQTYDEAHVARPRLGTR